KLDGALRPLYTVRFAQRDLWPDYGGQPHDTLVADIFEHWLEATD
ncbi:MAG: nitrile hydratase subunit beta, partial [Candidatus Lambdaproteobacteria bacterium]|nr:nitrile hydratase subunit beta [Candidatus Lambdaproteobacteria bacterium]